MKWKLFARRMSVSAPKMSVKRHVPWPVRIAMWAAAILVGGFGAIGIWQATVGKGAEEREKLVASIAQSEEKLKALEKERASLSELSKSADSLLQIEKTTVDRLSQQVRTLEQENAKLKSDLAYMEGLLPTSANSAGASGVTLRQFEVVPDVVAGQYRYRALLMQAGREGRDFAGTTQLLVSGAAGGKASTISLPGASDKAAADRMQVKFTRYLRIEGSFEVPKDFQVKTVQLRVLEQGSLRVQSQVAI